MDRPIERDSNDAIKGETRLESWLGLDDLWPQSSKYTDISDDSILLGAANCDTDPNKKSYSYYLSFNEISY